MIEVVGGDSNDDRSSRTSRTRLKSTTPTLSKVGELKDWRGKISQANLPEYAIHIFNHSFFFLKKSVVSSSVRNRLRREHSASVVSPQRPCTAASNFSKSRHDSSGALVNDSQKEQGGEIVSQADSFFFSI